MKIKYVIFDDVYPAIISDANQHADVRGVGHKPTSAGFFSLQQVEDKNPQSISLMKWEVHCWGESISLGIKSQPEYDALIIGRMFNISY